MLGGSAAFTPLLQPNCRLPSLSSLRHNQLCALKRRERRAPI